MGVEGGEMSNIPSDEDFARAKAIDKERSRNMDAVNESVLHEFIGRTRLHYFIIIPQIKNEFLALIFYKNESDIEICRNNGITSNIESFVYAELDRHGRGNKSEIRVVFEVDSDEAVNRNFGGDYFLRLR
jgi:hypothetical protein